MTIHILRSVQCCIWSDNAKLPLRRLRSGRFLFVTAVFYKNQVNLYKLKKNGKRNGNILDDRWLAEFVTIK